MSLHKRVAYIMRTYPEAAWRPVVQALGYGNDPADWILNVIDPADRNPIDPWIPWIAQQFGAHLKQTVRGVRLVVPRFKLQHMLTESGDHARMLGDQVGDPWGLEQIFKLPRSEREQTIEWLDRRLEIYDNLNQELIFRIGELADWLQAERPDLRGVTLADALRESTRWHADLSRRIKDGDVEQGKIVYRFGDGWTAQELRTSTQLDGEGGAMGHCVAGYTDRIQRGDSRIVSLRDEQGRPHVTIETSPRRKGEVLQARGKGNDLPVPRHCERVVQYLESTGLPRDRWGEAIACLPPEEIVRAWSHGEISVDALSHFDYFDDDEGTPVAGRIYRAVARIEGLYVPDGDDVEVSIPSRSKGDLCFEFAIDRYVYTDLMDTELLTLWFKQLGIWSQVEDAFEALGLADGDDEAVWDQIAMNIVAGRTDDARYAYASRRSCYTAPSFTNVDDFDVDVEGLLGEIEADRRAFFDEIALLLGHDAPHDVQRLSVPQQDRLRLAVVKLVEGTA